MEILIFTQGYSTNYQSVKLSLLIFIYRNCCFRLKEGDRFWYENGLDSNIRFTTRQLKEIKQVRFNF